MDKLKQLNIIYVPVEDRLLLRIAVQSGEKTLEYKAWLTRRLVILLWQSLQAIVETVVAAESGVSPAGRAAMSELRREEALSQLDFSTPYSRPDNIHHPLGSEPIRISRYVVKKRQDHLHVLSLLTDNDTGVHLTMDRPLVFSLQKLLSDTIKQTGWNLEMALGSSSKAAGMPEKLPIQ